MNSPFIVGIGASAGGLEALKEFFKSTPQESGLTYIVIQHLSPDYKSMMPSLLGRVTDIPITIATDGVQVAPDHIYLIPASNNIVLEGDQLIFRPRAAEHTLNLSIDTFFRSLADQREDRSIGVILSGTGSDGTLGGKSIKEKGGAIFVQDPRNIQFSGMPNNAIVTGIADYILPADQIPSTIINYINSERLQLKYMSDQDSMSYDLILQLIKDKIGTDYSQYRPQTLTRRIMRRIHHLKLQSIDQYLMYLQNHEYEVEELSNEFLIGVTSFFRDPEYINVIKESIIPALFKNTNNTQLKLWHIGCSTGEEVYTIAILLQSYIDENNLGSELSFKIFATDLDKTAIETASRGTYSHQITQSIPKELINKYFITKNGTHTINPVLRKNIIFSPHDILTDPPLIKMDMAICRNLLIYLNAQAQQKIFKSIIYALNEGGYLFLGGSESIGKAEKHFKTIDRRAKIFQKNTKNINRKELLNLFNEEWYSDRRKKENYPNEEIVYESLRVLTEMTDSICIIVNQHLQISKIYGDFNKIATFPKGGFELQNLKLVNLLPKEFNIPVTSILAKAKHDRAELTSRTISFEKNGSSHVAKLSIKPIRDKKIKDKLYMINIMIIGHQKDLLDKQSKNISNNTVDEYKYLEQTLNDTRENLQLTIEELEASNEEAQATNEELISSNEELQSTNEELQSVNEELNSVNVELEERNQELIDLNADHENLIRSSGAINFFVSKDLRIKSFTTTENEVFTFAETDIGRPLKELSLPDQNILEDIQKVITTLQKETKEIHLPGDRWYKQSMQPYRAHNHVVSGVVINYADITEIKKTNLLFDHILESIPGIVYIYDLDEKKNVFVNRSSKTIIGWDEATIRKSGTKLMDILIHPDDLPHVRAHHEKLKTAKSDQLYSIMYRVMDTHQSVNAAPQWVISYDRPINRKENGSASQICGICVDIDTFKSKHDKVEEKNELLNEILEQSPSEIIIYDYINEQSITTSPKIADFFRMSDEDLEGIILNHTLFRPFLDKVNYNILDITIQDQLKKGGEESVNKEYKLSLQDGTDKWIYLSSTVKDRLPNGAAKSLMFFITDITHISELKENQKKLQRVNKELEEFAYISSHDLQQPLKTIQGSIGIINNELKDNTSPIVQHSLSMINSTVTNMSATLKSVLEYAGFRSNAKFKRTRINMAVKSVINDLQQKIEESGADIKVNVMHEVYADPNLLRLLIQNLLSNALKFAKPEVAPSIIISSKKVDDNITLSIKDNGIGIPEKQLDRIFILFQRLNNNDEYQGSGIGLAHVKKIMEIHDGDIDVNSKVGVGTEFYCSFPTPL